MALQRRIVLADDCSDAVALMKFFLQSLGFVVTAVGDGEAALRAIVEHQPEVALLDITLPLMSGLEVAQAVCKDPSLASVLLIACTGHGGREHERASLEAGFERHLTKPVDFGELERLLDELLGSR